MAKQKTDLLSVGRGAVNDSSNAIHAFSANNSVAVWSNAVSYSQYNVIEYGTKVYRSKVNTNLANQPDLSPNQWETLYDGVADGDIAFIYAGVNSTTLQRIGGTWSSLSGTPAAVALVDGQLTPAAGFTFPVAFSRMVIVYSITRGASNRIRQGTYTVLNDGVGNIEYSEEFTTLGGDTNVTFQGFVVSGPNIEWRYTSLAEAVAITLHFSLKGW